MYKNSIYTLFISVILIGCVSNPSKLTTSSNATIDTSNLEIVTDNELMNGDKHFEFIKRVRDRVLQPFIPIQKALDGAKIQAAQAGANALYITSKGSGIEEHLFGTASFYHIEGLALRWVQPTEEKIKEVLENTQNKHPLEVKSAIRWAEENSYKNLSNMLFEKIKNKETRYSPDMTKLLCKLSGTGYKGELIRFLKFHSDEFVRIEAGKGLIELGLRDIVENALRNDESKTVRNNLRDALL